MTLEKKTRKRKKATMADVAAAVGVSKTTVSRYLHGDYEFMSEDFCKRSNRWHQYQTIKRRNCQNI